MGDSGSVRDVQHLIRLGVLIVLLAAAFLVGRSLLVPDSFGEYGHYRGAALAEISARAPVFAGRAACEECHVDVAEERAGGRHERLSCEGCHGPLADHAADPVSVAATVPDQVRCEACHEANPYRPAWMPQVDTEDHAMGETCTDCHQPHRPGFD